MSSVLIRRPFEVFTDSDGQPLDDGYLYVGVANLNPETNLKAIYWDQDLTIPALQPIRTMAGYPVRNGTPARFYTAGDYSITVKNKAKYVVFNAPNADSLDLLLASLSGPGGASSIGYQPDGAGSVELTVGEALNLWVTDVGFGTVGDGVVDDTLALQRVLDHAASLRISAPTTSGSFSAAHSGNMPRIYLKRQKYKISNTLVCDGYLDIVGANCIIEMTDPTKPVFSCEAYQVKVKGIQTVGGLHSFDIYNANINSTLVELDGCQFFLTRSYAVNTRATGGVFTHLSANLSIKGSRFIGCNKVLNNCCDNAVIEGSWIQPIPANTTASFAFILNKGASVTDPEAYTRLHIKDTFLIPDVGTYGVDRAANIRWVDNYGSFQTTRARFGGEFGGIPIVYHLGAPNTTFPWAATEVVLKESLLFGGPDADPGSCIIGIQGQVPQRVVIEDCSGPVGNPLIANLSALAIPAYMTTFEAASGKKAYEYFKIKVDDVITDIGAYIPMRSRIPDDLFKFATKCKQTRIRRAATQSIANGFVNNLVSFDTIEFDNVGAWAVANPTRITMPNGCSKMRIQIAVQMAVDGAAKTMAVTLVTSGITRLAGDTILRGINPDTERITFSADVEGVPGSYWHVNIQHNAVGALNLLDCRVSCTPLDFMG